MVATAREDAVWVLCGADVPEEAEEALRNAGVTVFRTSHVERGPIDGPPPCACSGSEASSR